MDEWDLAFTPTLTCDKNELHDGDKVCSIHFSFFQRFVCSMEKRKLFLSFILHSFFYFLFSALFCYFSVLVFQFLLLYVKALGNRTKHNCVPPCIFWDNFTSFFVLLPHFHCIAYRMRIKTQTKYRKKIMWIAEEKKITYTQ